MLTATLEETEVSAEIHHHGIPLPERFEAEPDVQAALDTLSTRQYKHDAMVEAWRDSFDALIADALQVKTRELDEGGSLWKRAAKLREQHADLETSAVAIAWERFELRPRLVPSFRNAVSRQRAIFDRLLTDEMQRLVEFRVVDGLPAANHGNQEALEHQLRHKAEQDECVIIALGAVRRAEAALEQLQLQMDICPRLGNQKIAWPSFTGFAAKIAALLGLDGSAGPVEPRPSFMARLNAAIFGDPKQVAAKNFERLKCERILHHLGLSGAALLPRHEAIIEELAAMVTIDHSNPLLAAPDAARVHNLVAQLPPTPQVREWRGSSIAIVDRN